MNRCTISHHKLTLNEEHIDIFLETKDFLETYQTHLGLFLEFLEGKPILCEKTKPHRFLYLDYEGEVSKGRGSVKILWKGFYLKSLEDFPLQISIKLLDEKNISLEI